MSSLEEKLAQPRADDGGKARATRAQLLARRCSVEEAPGRITIDAMGGRELWLRVAGDLFEQEVRS